MLRFDGKSLAHVTLSVGGQQTLTDGTGRFLLLLPGAPSGHAELGIDGRSANRPRATYGGARLAYAGAAKAISMAPGVTGAEANLARNVLKALFRGGLFPSYRWLPYEEALAQKGSDAAVKAAAGRTDTLLNKLGRYGCRRSSEWPWVRVPIRGPYRFFDWRAFLGFLALSGMLGYLVHTLSGLELGVSIMLAIVAVLLVGLSLAFGGKR